MPSALVIDDTRITADSLVSVLNALNMEARAAYGPGAGLNILKVETPDVIFLDINMPGVSGFEILSFLGREPRLSKVPVFVVTSDDQPETAKHAIASGARAVIIKPVSMDALEEALKKENLLA